MQRDINIVEIVLMCFFDSDGFVLVRFMLKITNDFFLAGNILRSDAVRYNKIIIRATKKYLSSKITSSWSYLNYPIRCFNKIIIMFYNNNCIA
jgi:hypothetical protein